MKKSVMQSQISGTVTAPASKSYFQRLIALSLLSEGTVEILNPDYCSDVDSALSAARKLGAVVSRSSKSLKITGVGGRAMDNTLTKADRVTEIDCGESGLALRMFSPVAALFDREFIMSGRGSLLSRPVGMITDALAALGVETGSSSGFPPVKVKGPLKGGRAEIDGSVSSQLLTGLLISLPLSLNNSIIYVNNLKSKPYIDMTLDLIEKFGGTVINNSYMVFEIKGMQRYVPPRRIEAEGDWSGAAFLLAAAALGGSVRINNLRKDSKQADRAVLDALMQTGASLITGDDYVEAAGRGVLYPFEFDAGDCPDLFPPLAALASGCSGISRIHGVERLKHKESDREKTLISEFSKAGIKIESDGRTMEITGGRIIPFAGDSHNDHRIAMALAAAAVRVEAGGAVTIENADAVDKSYPGFFNDFALIGGNTGE